MKWLRRCWTATICSGMMPPARKESGHEQPGPAMQWTHDAPPSCPVVSIRTDALCVALMATTRTLRLADGGRFRIGPGTVSVHVSTVPMDPPAVLLHVNRSCGALELAPDADGNTPPPVRVDAARALGIVQQINNDRAMAAMRGGRAEPLVELPPHFKATARHVAAWKGAVFPHVHIADEAVGYPSKNTPTETLWVKRETGACVLERIDVPPGLGVVSLVSWHELTPERGVEWLEANGYTAIPATLHRLARTRKGAKRDAPSNDR